MVVGLFPDGRERARAIGIYSFVGAAGAAIGLLAGGVLTETLGWHWVFLVNVPIGDACTAVLARSMSARPTARPLPERAGTSPAAVLITAGVMLTVYTITEAPARGWISVPTIGCAAARRAAAGRVRHPRASRRIPCCR